MGAYSIDLRKRVLAASDEGQSSEDIAEQLRVSRSWVDRVKQRYRENGEIGPRKIGGYRQSVFEPHLDELHRLLKEKPDQTLKELRDALGVQVGITAMWNVVKALGYTLKKTPARR